MTQPAGRFIPEAVAEAIHAYLMTRPCNETFDLVVQIRQSPVVKAPKPK